MTPAEAKKIWRYEKTDKGKIRILGYKGRKLEITIPARIGGAPVTEIGPNAFSPTQKPLLKEQRELRENITSVKIPEGVTAIGASAFEGCAALTQLEFPESLRSLNSSQKICKNCTALIQIRLPNVKQIPNEAFAGCEALERIVIPASVTKIAQKAFSCGWIGQCPKLTIHAPAGSYAEQFAKERDISFQAI